MLLCIWMNLIERIGSRGSYNYESQDSILHYADLGLVLFLDEAYMFGNDFGGFLGDWSAFHIEPFHHWMLGLLLIAVSTFLILVHEDEDED